MAHTFKEHHSMVQRASQWRVPNSFRMLTGLVFLSSWRRTLESKKIIVSFAKLKGSELKDRRRGINPGSYADLFKKVYNPVILARESTVGSMMKTQNLKWRGLSWVASGVLFILCSGALLHKIWFFWYSKGRKGRNFSNCHWTREWG